MLHKRDIICISSIDWDFVWQGHQEIMDTFVREGNRVLFIENTGVRVPKLSDMPRIRKRLTNWIKSIKGIRQEKENLFIYSPVIFPFPFSKIAAFLNRLIMLPFLKTWMRTIDFTNPIIWTFLPTRVSIDLIKNIDHDMCVYYCIADFDELVNNKKALRKHEKVLLENVDLVFAQGTVLRDRCKKYNENVRIFPFGVKGGLFNRTVNRRSTSLVPEDIKHMKNKRIGYVGGIHKHIDYELIENMAMNQPDWDLILIGPDQVGYGNAEKPENIRMLGMKKFEELPGYIEHLDLCIIPYALNDYTSTVYPTKLNEYLLIGKPVVSTALPEVKEFNRIHNGVVNVASSREEFLDLSRKAINHKDSREDIERRKNAALGNTWEKRIEQMSRSIEEKIAEKNTSRNKGWKENLLRIYRAGKRRSIAITLSLILAYLIVFYSPLVWFLASPLKISDMPVKSDCIVVFGGGVGETGSPGKSTIERARFGAELYKDGYAKKIIFSSGYTYKENDAENMKIIAASMGVPAKDIILEKKANSAYENVKFSGQILNERYYNNIIVVSSPYNMRRVSMVYDRIGGNIKRVYVPVPAPHFYYRDKKVRIGQIRAILHEYLGIIYYMFKGYI